MKVGTLTPPSKTPRFLTLAGGFRTLYVDLFGKYRLLLLWHESRPLKPIMLFHGKLEAP